MVTRNVVLTYHQEELVSQLVSSGRYQNASEALRAGLRLLEREEIEVADLRTRLAEGLRQAHSGEFADGDGVAAIRRVFRTARQSSR
jgi:antitoxin ParD1/3/4